MDEWTSRQLFLLSFHSHSLLSITLVWLIRRRVFVWSFWSSKHLVQHDCLFQMSLWCDKYRPKTFEELDYQLDRAVLLQTIVASGDFPHFLIFGPSGAGKKTRISCLLHALYGDGVQSLRIENHEYETPSRKKIEITTIGSNFHTQVNPRYDQYSINGRGSLNCL